MTKALKCILVFALPALACGALWLLGILLGLVIENRSRGPQQDLGEILYLFAACAFSALAMGVAFHRIWLRSTWPRLWGWSALHEICGATLFGTLIFPVIGTFYGFLLAFPLMPVQILGSVSQILIFRHLHAHFLAPKEPPAGRAMNRKKLSLDCRFSPGVALWPLLALPMFWVPLGIGNHRYSGCEMIFFASFSCIGTLTALVTGGALYGSHIAREEARPVCRTAGSAVVLFIVLGLSYVFLSAMLYMTWKAVLFHPAAA